MNVKNLKNWILLFLMGGMLLASCDSGEDPQVLAPVIKLDVESGIYTAKVGKSITITPTYENAANASFAWIENGKIISQEQELTYISNELGDKYITLVVITSAGETVKEIRISVLDLVLPVISYNVPEAGLTIMRGVDFTFEPVVENADNATYAWYVNDVKVGEVKNLVYKNDTNGEYTVRLVVTNEDGSSEITFPLNVRNAEDIPFKWDFEYDTYNVSSGRSIRILARDVENDFNGDYTWSVNGTQVKTGKDKFYLFDKTEQGTYTVTVKMQNQYNSTGVTKELTVNVCAPEGTYKRAITASSSARWNKVYEFLAAPGQFVNEGYNATTMEEACAYAESRMGAATPNYVSLGGWGGYIVVGFDHSVENSGGYDLQIQGNAFNGSSEPGIVWVMQDENGNGLPDDTWYELKGSDYDYETRDYSVTYYKPSTTQSPVQWTDNQGESGSVDYNSWHRQDYYYPNWVTTETYTLHGSKLVSRTTQNSSGIWINAGFDWGYVDNWSSTDMIDSSASTSNHVRISDAVTWDGKPANLQYIDFVKVQTALNAKAGVLGENSTEVFNFKDYNMIK